MLHDKDQRVHGPVDGQASPRYSGLTTFARLPRSEDVVSPEISIVGVPFDSAVTYRPGARFAPSAIREASRLLKPYNPAMQVYPFASVQVADAGDIDCNPFSIEQAHQQIEAGVKQLISDRKRAVILGGDHSLALPALRAVTSVHGPVALVHFDAHLDTWDTYFDAPYTHGSPFRRAFEEGLLVKEKSVHLGIRGTLYDEQDLRDDSDMGFTIIDTRAFSELGAEAAMRRVLEHVGDAPIYLSIDIDVVDPGLAPGTGTPEPGGLLSRELIDAVRLFRGSNLVGADIVEVLPAYDHAGVTALTAATLGYEIISVFAAQMNPEHG